MNGWGHAKRLHAVEAPTVVVHGAEDRLVHVLNGRRLGEAIPGATYVELEGVGHLPPLEAPERLRELIAGLEPAGSSGLGAGRSKV